MDSFLSPALRELLAAIFAKDPGARPTAGEILTGTWMTHGGDSESAPVANAARIAAALEIRKPTKDSRNTHSVPLPGVAVADAVARVAAAAKRLEGAETGGGGDQQGSVNLLWRSISVRCEVSSDGAGGSVVLLLWTSGYNSDSWIRLLFDMVPSIRQKGSFQ